MLRLNAYYYKPICKSTLKILIKIVITHTKNIIMELIKQLALCIGKYSAFT